MPTHRLGPLSRSPLLSLTVLSTHLAARVLRKGPPEYIFNADTIDPTAIIRRVNEREREREGILCKIKPVFCNHADIQPYIYLLPLPRFRILAEEYTVARSILESLPAREVDTRGYEEPVKWGSGLREIPLDDVRVRILANRSENRSVYLRNR